MTNFSLNDIFVQVFEDLFAYINIDHKFMCEVPQSTMNSTEMVNTLVGISGDLEGNIMFGYTSETAKDIARKITGNENIKEVDIYVKAALADFFSEFCKRAIQLLKTESLYNIKYEVKDYTLLSSSPTYVSGQEMYGVISKVPSKKLFFKVNGEKFGIAYSLEQK